MYRIFPVIYFVAALIFISCSNNKSENNEEINPEAIYFDYKVTGSEDDDNLTVMLQYKNGGIEGDAVAIEEWGKVLLDGEQLVADSAGMTGTFYEVYKPISAFTGKHKIDFFRGNQKKYTEEFDFQPFSFLTPIPDKFSRNNLVFDFNGLKDGEFVRVLLTDTSFTSNGINRLDTVKNGQIIVTGKELENLVNGPVQLEFIKEFEKPIKRGTKRMGNLSISYSIKRNFLLQDTVDNPSSAQ